MTPLKWFSGFLKKYRLAIVIGLVLMTVIVACAIVNPYISIFFLASFMKALYGFFQCHLLPLLI